MVRGVYEIRHPTFYPHLISAAYRSFILFEFIRTGRCSSGVSRFLSLVVVKKRKKTARPTVRHTYAPPLNQYSNSLVRLSFFMLEVWKTWPANGGID